MLGGIDLTEGLKWSNGVLRPNQVSFLEEIGVSGENHLLSELT